MNMMQTLKRKKSIIILIACCLLVLTAVYQHIANKQDTLSVLKLAEPDVASFKEIEGPYATYELIAENGQFLSYGVISSASGYGGPITMLTAINKEGEIKRAVILDNAETPTYLSRVVESGYPENLQGQRITESLRTNQEIDAVSGATRSVEGILSAVEKGIGQVGENQLGFAVPKVNTYHFQWEDGAIVLLLILAVIAAIRKVKKLRIPLLIASVFIIGFMAKSSLSLGNFMSIVMNKIPVITERPIWFVLVIGILVVTLILGKNVYCGWLCPFGAVQEGIYKSLHLTKNRLEPKIVSASKKSQWLMIWLAAMLAFLFNNPGIASYEPFSPFFGGEANTPQWIMMGLIILASIVVLRFWCRCFCPVGTVLDFLAQAKRKGKKLFMKKSRSQLNTAITTESSCASCKSCKSGCGKSEKKTVPLSTFNKFIVFLIVVIDLLIIATLLQNIGLI